MRRLHGAWPLGIVAALGLLAPLATVAVAAAAEDGPLAVTPGSSAGSEISQSCPTFSWSAVDSAQSYELVAYKVPKGAAARAEPGELEELWRASVPGGARSWTPSSTQCFTHGGRYAWAVRAVVSGRASAWSGANLFTVEKAPSTEEVRQAMATIQRYLALHPGKLPAAEKRKIASNRGATSVAAKKGKKKSRPRKASVVDFSVDGAGNVAGASFTGGAFSGTGFAAAGGDVSTDHQLVSSVASGTAPLDVISTTLVPNLNSDTVDGFHAAAAPTAGDLLVLNSDGQVPITTLANIDVVPQVPRSNLISEVDLGGEYSSITIGADGNPVISYKSGSGLKVAKCNDPACTGGDETVTLVGGGGLYTSIAIGADGFPVVSADNGEFVKCLDASCSSSGSLSYFSSSS